MRIRIALATALAVIAVSALLFALLNKTPAASARATHHEAVRPLSHEALGPRTATKINFKLMSYAQAEQVAKLATFYNAVMAHKEATYLKDVQLATYFKDVQVATYLKDVAFFKAVALQKQQQAAAPAAAPAPAAAAAPAQVPAPAPTPAPTPTTGSSDATSTNTPNWACIRQHESGDNYAEDGGGAYQFEFGTWQGLTGLEFPAQDYPPSVQDAAALRLYAQRGWEPWTTRFVCGL